MNEKINLETPFSHQTQLKKGILWLGGASVVAKVIDVLSVVVIVLFLTREEMGLATLAWSVVVFCESLVGLGMNTALIQAKKIDQNQIVTAHWFVLITVVVIVIFLFILAPLFSRFYEEESLVMLIRVVSLKILFVGLAHVPLALIYRKLEFKLLAAITTVATLFASSLNIVFAMIGFGEWAPILSNLVHGLFQFIGASLVVRIRPRLIFDWQNLRPLAQFGLKVGVSNGIRQFTRNIDYFLIGKFLSVQVLGVYRVAFDLAVTPANEIVKVVKRAVLPVFSRMEKQSSEVERSLYWSLRGLLLMLLPFVVIISSIGADIVLLTGKAEWAGIGNIIPILCVGALFFAINQIFIEFFNARGMPRFSVVHATLAMVVVLFFMSSALWFSPEQYRLQAACAAWSFSYFCMHAFEVFLTRRYTGFGFIPLLKTWFILLLATILLIIPLLGVRWSLSSWSAGWRVGILVATAIGFYALIVRYLLRFKLKDLLKQA